MDSPGAPPAGPVIPRAWFLLLLLVPSLRAASQASERVDTVRGLYDAGRWEEVIRQTQDPAALPPELDFLRGMALAKLNRWDDSRKALEDGERKSPGDKRFPIELAAIAFHEKNFKIAKRLIRRALRLDPQDNYANDFLATLYDLDGNLPAALKYWNRAGKPRLGAIQVDPPLDVDPQLLDRAFAAAPSAELRLEDYSLTQRRLQALDIFSASRLDLVPETNSQDYDLRLAAVERDGWGSSKLAGILSIAAGVPYQTVYPAFYNLHRSAINFQSLLRWDSKKRRAYAAFSAPLGGKPGWRFRLYADGRDEDWNAASTFHGASGALSDFKMRKIETGAQFLGTVSSRLIWQSGVAISWRTFSGASPAVSPDFADSFALEVRSGVSYALWHVAERRFTLDSFGSAELGRAYAQGLGTYGGLRGGLAARWLPLARGDDYEVKEEFRAGEMLGPIPFDKLFILGLERDNDLPLRAHIGTHDGMKGSAPLGRAYVLSNWEINKNVFDSGWFRLRLAPFLDAGRAYDDTRQFGSERWLYDTGGELKIGLLGGIAVVLTYGKDLRTGRNAFYATVVRPPGAWLDQ
jgi:tetratricopeptide (TPR) repeat protein